MAITISQLTVDCTLLKWWMLCYLDVWDGVKPLAFKAVAKPLFTLRGLEGGVVSFYTPGRFLPMTPSPYLHTIQPLFRMGRLATVTAAYVFGQLIPEP